MHQISSHEFKTEKTPKPILLSQQVENSENKNFEKLATNVLCRGPNFVVFISSNLNLTNRNVTTTVNLVRSNCPGFAPNAVAYRLLGA